jgi:hypothetical protein
MQISTCPVMSVASGTLSDHHHGQAARKTFALRPDSFLTPCCGRWSRFYAEYQRCVKDGCAVWGPFRGSGRVH